MDVETSFPFIGFQAFIGSSRWTGGGAVAQAEGRKRGQRFMGYLNSSFTPLHERLEEGPGPGPGHGPGIGPPLLHLILPPFSRRPIRAADGPPALD